MYFLTHSSISKMESAKNKLVVKNRHEEIRKSRRLPQPWEPQVGACWLKPLMLPRIGSIPLMFNRRVKVLVDCLFVRMYGKVLLILLVTEWGKALWPPRTLSFLFPFPCWWKTRNMLWTPPVPSSATQTWMSVPSMRPTLWATLVFMTWWR